jgi:hypothetical protein
MVWQSWTPTGEGQPNVRVVARREEAPISVGGLLGVATHDLFAFLLVDWHLMAKDAKTGLD